MSKYMTQRWIPPTVPRTPEEPSPEQVFIAMDPGEPYTAGEVAEQFPDASRWTVKRRLDKLVSTGFVEKKRHSERRVSYWVPPEK